MFQCTPPSPIGTYKLVGSCASSGGGSGSSNSYPYVSLHYRMTCFRLFLSSSSTFDFHVFPFP